jgi:hypothetical protein
MKALWLESFFFAISLSEVSNIQSVSLYQGRKGQNKILPVAFQ